MRWFWPGLMAIVLAVVLCGPAAAAEPTAKHGVIDLRNVDFSRGNGIDLAGEWGFVPGADAGPAFSWQVGDFIEQPGYWNDVYPGQGNVALALRVLLPENAPPLALAMPDVNSAWRLHVDGELLRSLGRLGENADAETPVLERTVVPLPLGRVFIDLVLEISNHHHHEGGVRTALRLGSADRFTQEEERLTALPLAALGALLMVTLMALAFYAGGKRDPAFLLFALFTVLVAMRTFATAQLYVLIGHDLRSDFWYFPPAYATIFVFPGVFTAFLREMLPGRIPKAAATAAYVCSGAALSLIVLTPPVFYTALHDFFMAADFAVALLGAAVIARAAAAGENDTWWLLAGTSVFAASMGNDILHYAGVWKSTYLLSLGFAAFATCYCAALALRMFRAERTASERLALLNRDLEGEVALRTASLAEAKDAAERASHAKSEFLAVMSHEIRTPLHGWAGLAELLSHTRLDAEQQRYVRLLRRTADQLARLIGNILDLAGLETGRTEINPAPILLDDLIDETAALVRAHAGDRGQSFHLDRSGDFPPAALVDDGAVLQIVRTLLDRFGGAGGGFVLRVAVDDDNLVFHMQGPGRDDVESSGEADIGRALCAGLIGGMNGDLQIDDNDGGDLRRVRFAFPLVAADPPADQPVPAQINHRVLIADDVELNRLVLRGFLASAGWSVDEAADGAQAVRMFAPGRYDLVILDLRMPVMDGFRAARAIRSRETQDQAPPIPIVALSAGAAADRRSAQESGFTLFLAKPIGAADLLKAVDGLLPADSGKESVATDGRDPGPPAPPPGLESLMPRFVDEMEQDADRLLALVDGDARELAEHVHAVRGKCGMFGEEILFALLSDLEERVNQGRIAEIAPIVAAAVERARGLRQYLAP